MAGHHSDPGSLDQTPRVKINLKAAAALATWREALGGTVSVQVALEGLVRGLGAECGTLVRSLIDDPRPVRLALCDLSGRAQSRRLSRTFAQTCFGPMLFASATASFWLGSAHQAEATGDPSLADWQATRGLREFAVLVLSCSAQTRDHLELHFRDPVPGDLAQSLAAMLPELARVWTGRRVALATRIPVGQRRNDLTHFRTGTDMRILDPDNPQRLSRTEFRVCLMLSTGLQVDGISAELGLSRPTVRTHLRSILAKTGCGSVAELEFRLTDKPAPRQNVVLSKSA